jgi:hypothetical protein
MRMAEVVVDDSVMQHVCGFPLRVHVEIAGIDVDQRNLPKMLVRYSDVKVRYQRLNDPEYLTHCPRCSEAFPMAVTDE